MPVAAQTGGSLEGESSILPCLLKAYQHFGMLMFLSTAFQGSFRKKTSIDGGCWIEEARLQNFFVPNLTLYALIGFCFWHHVYELFFAYLGSSRFVLGMIRERT